MSTPGRTADEAMIYNTINIPRITVSPGQEGQGRNNFIRVLGVAEALNYMTTGAYLQLGSDGEAMEIMHATMVGNILQRTSFSFMTRTIAV
jgi:hypothetical protein